MEASKQARKQLEQNDNNGDFTAGGHPLRKLKRQTLEELEDEFMKYDKPCVQLINKRPQEKPVEEKISVSQIPHEPIVIPIQERQRDVVEVI